MISSRASLLLVVVGVCVAAGGLSGCSKKAKEKTGAETDAVHFRGGSMAPSETREITVQQPVDEGYVSTASQVGSPAKKPELKPPANAKVPIERKIIYTATIHVIVADLDAAQKKLDALRTAHKAYVATANVSGQTGTQRSGTWTIRLPAEQFEAFRKALLDFGYPQQDSLTSDDITQKYYSLESRLKTREATRQRLLKHLDESKNRPDTVALENELDRVVGTIEDMKTQLQVWQTLTALTTVHLTLIEKKNYQPPQEPTFASRIGDTFGGSFDALAAFGRGLTLFLVALVPWLPVLAVVIVPTWWAIRRSRRKAANRETLL